MNSIDKLPIPTQGEPISVQNGRFLVPDHPILPFIEGDGVGPDVWRAARMVFDAAVQAAYGGSRSVVWYEVFAGEKAYARFGDWLPQDTLDAIGEFRVAIKGPLTTPVGDGIRSLNVGLRQLFDLYVCMRPVRYYPGVPSPMKRPDLLNVVIFRENTEDLYAGIEWRQGTPQAQKLIEFLKTEMGKTVRPDSGIGIKPISVTGSKRLIRSAIRYALENGRRSVTLVHKGNIMKFTEGAFRDWGYELAREEFGEVTTTEDEVNKKYGGNLPPGKVTIKDRIADAMFQEVLLRPAEYDVIATPNLNGDFLSDACAAQVGGLGMAPGANLGDEHAVFEATHGTAPKLAGLDFSNPSGLILSGSLMFRFLNWKEAADLIESGVTETIREKRVTFDLYQQTEGAVRLHTSEFAARIVENMNACVAA